MDPLAKDADIRRRFADAAAMLGMTEAQALRKAGVAHDLFNHPPTASGRRRRTLERMGEAVGKTADWLYSGEGADLADPNPHLAQIALVIDVACHLYYALSRHGGITATRGNELARSVLDLIDQSAGSKGSGE